MAIVSEEMRRNSGLALAAAVVLWVVGVAVVAGGVWADRGSRSAGPEAAFVAYAAAVERGSLDNAMAQLVPEVRQGSESWVAWQMGNRYRILEMAVKSDSALDRVLGRGDASRATVVASLEIDGKGNPSWRALEEIPARLVEGRWLLEKPPLEGR